MNIPASIGGPIAGLHAIVVPLWYMIFYRKCLGAKTAAGYVLSSASVVLFSGLIDTSVSYNMTVSHSICLLLIFLSWGFGLITQAEASKGCTFKQFPQVNTFMTIGNVMGYIMFVCGINASDITKKSTWTPLGVDKLLALVPTVCTSLGTGFFSLCLLYTEDTNLMVAITSLSIVIPVILGIGFLDEPATWNVLLGVVLALLGMVILSFEVKEGTDTPKEDLTNKNHSISTNHQGNKTPLLSVTSTTLQVS